MTAFPLIHTDPISRGSVLIERIDAEEDTTLLAMDLRVLDRCVPHELVDPLLAAGSVRRPGGPSIPELLIGDDQSDIDENPHRTFRAVAATVKAESMFRFESMGVEVTVRIVERYLADHRQLFVADPQQLTELRRILEVFARVGWPAALHLSYSLGDIFR